MVTYFLKRCNKYIPGTPLEEQIVQSKSCSQYEILENCKNGVLYYDGTQIDFNEFLKGNIVPINNKKIDSMFSDLFN